MTVLVTQSHVTISCVPQQSTTDSPPLSTLLLLGIVFLPLGHSVMNSISSAEMALRRPPVACLPIEMLSAIFEAAPFIGIIAPEERLKFTLAVSQVSRLWRQTAMHTSFLWSSILLLAECGQGWRELMKLMIKLSRSHPLNITVDLFRDAEDTQFRDILGLQLDIIIPEISRWKRLYYIAGFYGDAFLFFEPISFLSAPILEALEVAVETEEEQYLDQALGVFMGGAPLLSRVAVDGMTILSCLPPISSLTSLRLFDPPGPIDFGLFTKILTASSALTELMLDGDALDEGQIYQFYENGEFVDLSTLRSLRLKVEIFPKHQFFSLLAPASTQLELHYVDCTQIGADFDVTKLPALIHIKFYQCPTSIFLLSNLIPAVEDEVNIWPLLKVISLDMGSLDDSDVNRLCKVLSYRTQCGKPIECVRFDTILVDGIADDFVELSSSLLICATRSLLLFSDFLDIVTVSLMPIGASPASAVGQKLSYRDKLTMAESKAHHGVKLITSIGWPQE
ncbi:hypothetical protein PILCRDRAFT_12927 [Piloderma croceum F 1598]|uniref:F-box domain-containing protein n=1 Tax=Piloderma croceum (strain F 1598) TaxID=765440 RepID=A0A0C3EUX5_PILCF|nr:hypothetical protein PILCRDRAFT_12927 [Piloderma croceum F 1598]